MSTCDSRRGHTALQLTTPDFRGALRSPTDPSVHVFTPLRLREVCVNPPRLVTTTSSSLPSSVRTQGTSGLSRDVGVPLWPGPFLVRFPTPRARVPVEVFITRPFVKPPYRTPLHPPHLDPLTPPRDLRPGSSGPGTLPAVFPLVPTQRRVLVPKRLWSLVHSP